MAKITYENKETLNENSSIANKNKGRAEDWNEIKLVINETLLKLLGLDVDNWSSSTTYSINDTCCDDNRIFINKTGTNTTTRPSEDTTNWEFVAILTSEKKIDERLLNRQKYVVESDTTSIDIPVNVASGEFVKITMIQSGTVTEHERLLYIKPNNLSSFSYRTVRTTGSTTSESETTAKTKIIDGNNRIVVGHLDSVMTFITMIFFVGNGNKFNYYTNSAIASSNSVNQFTQNGYIGSAYFNSNKIENITIFTDSSTVKIPAGTTFIVEKF